MAVRVLCLFILGQKKSTVPSTIFVVIGASMRIIIIIVTITKASLSDKEPAPTVVPL